MYTWLVFIQLLGLVLFAISDGASASSALRLRGERDPPVVASHLAASKAATGPMYIGLLLLVLGGLAAAGSGGLLLAPWVIASYVVLLMVVATMYGVASPYYGRLRELVGDGTRVDQAQLDAALASRRPEVLASVGAIGLLVLVFLMVVKPG